MRKFGKEILKSRRCNKRQDPRRQLRVVLKAVCNASRSLNERAGSSRDFFITNLKVHFTFQNKKGFVFTRMNVRRRPVVWRDAILNKRVYASCLRARSQNAKTFPTTEKASPSPGPTWIIFVLLGITHGVRALILSRISATACVRGFAPRLPLPWMRTLTASASMSRFPITNAPEVDGFSFIRRQNLDSVTRSGRQ